MDAVVDVVTDKNLLEYPLALGFIILGWYIIRFFISREDQQRKEQSEVNHKFLEVLGLLKDSLQKESENSATRHAEIMEKLKKL